MRTHRVFRRALAPALFASLLLAGCGHSPTQPSFTRAVTLFGYLYVGQPVSNADGIVLRRTQPVDQLYDPDDAAIRGATVLLQADGAAAADTLHETGPGRYSNSTVTITPRTTYHLTARFGTETITATTTTPAPFTVSSSPRSYPGVMTYASVPDSFPIVLDGPDPKQILYVDTYCLEAWQNARFVNPFGDNDAPSDYKEYGGDNGPPRHINAYFRLEDLATTPGGRRLGFYGDMMAFYGEYTVGVFAIDDNYYQYLYRDHPELHGGVTGGIGVFGSAFRRTWHIRTVK